MILPMKIRLFFVVCATVCVLSTFGVNKNTVPLSVVVRKGQTVFDDNALNVLCAKIKAAMSANGIMSDGYDAVAVCPSADVVGKNVIEGGMRSITVFDFQFTLTMLHVVTGAEFGSVVVPLRGEGYTEKDACLSALRKIDPSDKRLSEFLVTGCKKVVDYYEDNISSLITLAQTKAGMQQYEEALALLSSYPVSLSGYSRVAKEMTGIYAKWQTDVCGQIVQRARNAYATGNYEAATELLNYVDMQSSCAGEAKKLADEIRKAVGKERSDEMRLYKDMVNIAADIEKQRIKSIENVAKAYYQNQGSYVFLIR